MTTTGTTTETSVSDMKKTRQKPDKPRKDFPLSPANNGQWCKKIRGTIHYFGIWSSPDAAEAEYLRVREYLQGGRLPPTTTATEGIRLNRLANEFLNSKRALVESGELSSRTFRDYHAGVATIVDNFGGERLVVDCKPEDFSAYRQTVSKGRGLHSIGWTVTLARMLFGFAYDSELIEKPIRFGQQFNKPTKKSMRLDRARKQEKHGLKMFQAEEIRGLLKYASAQVRAMILLAVNGGLGNSDLANLPQAAVQRNWLVFPRIKTGVERRIPLWPETVDALHLAIESRPLAKDAQDAGLCFITKYGHRWVRTGPNGTSNIDKIADEFKKLLSDMNLKRERVGFYALRHTFETIGGGCGDQVAVSSIMGHIDDSMSSLYRERLEDSRLLAAVEHVRKWLFQPEEKPPAKAAGKKQTKAGSQKRGNI